ncbi:Protein of unknown function [Bacillus mycoides]|nr:Protein of unknown function [Bacillus mycoides]
MDTINEEYEIKVIDEFLIKHSDPIKCSLIIKID